MNTPNPTPIAESLKSILVIAEQSRNTENACDLIAKIANDALTRPSPSADDGDVEGLAQAALAGWYSDAQIGLSPSWPGLSAFQKGNWRRAVRAVLKALAAAPSRAAPAGDREGLEPLLTELAKPQFMTSTSHGSTHTVEFTFMGADGSTRRNSLHDALINAARYARALPAAPQAPVSAPIADGEG